MVLILIKLYLSRRFASIIRSSDTIVIIVNATIGVAVGVTIGVTIGITIGITVGITIEDGRFYPVAITVAIRIYILIVGNARRRAVIR